jgi:SAM-dependent methyltransferase
MDEETRRVALRTTFDEAAELYDRARPRYPRELVDDLVSLAGLHPGSRVLEIGVGTGQLTTALAHRGYEIVGVEMGAGLAAVAARNLGPFPNVGVVNATFEEWPLPMESFDLVVSASAFHWLDPETRVTKAADALRIGGSLATIGTNHVVGGDVAFFADTTACYERWDTAGITSSKGNAWPADLPAADQIEPDIEELERTGRFGPVTFRRHESDKTYTASEYLETLQTYSGHRALPDDERSGLLECIRDLIEARYGGRITKRYLFDLRIAPRRS